MLNAEGRYFALGKNKKTEERHEMKKRIIASILALVMTVLALVSCGGGFSFVEESDSYATVDLAKFLEALQKIKIEDADFTTNEATRLEKVKYNLYTTLTSAAVKEADKKTEGAITGRDVLYFCYYATYEHEGKTYTYFSTEMKTTAITSGTTLTTPNGQTGSKTNHVIEMATVKNNKDNKYGDALYDALIAAINAAGGSLTLKSDEEGNKVDKLYATTTTSGTSVKSGDTIFVSYTRVPVVADNATDEEKAAAKEESALYEMLVLDKDKYADGSAEDALVELILGEGMTAKVGSDVAKTTTTGEGSSATTSTQKEFTLTVDGKAYKYSAIGIEWISAKNNGPLVTFKYTPYNTKKELKPDNLRQSDEKAIDLNGKELTYYVYPVNYIEVPELTASTIITEIIGKSISTETIDILASETFKNGDVTVKAMVEELKKLWADDAETIKNFTNEKGDKTLEALKQAWDDAKKAHEDAEGGDHDHTALNSATTKAEEAYKEAKEYAVKVQADKICAAKATENEVEVTAGEKIMEQYAGKDGVIYKNLKATYNTAIVNSVGKEVWKLINDSDEYVKVNDYPAEIVDAFKKHLYETYEYEFYKGTDSTEKKSNFLVHGTLEAYMMSSKVLNVKSADEIDGAVETKAKEFIKPLLKVYALSIALAESDSVKVTEKMKQYVELDKAGGAYDVLNKDLSAEEKNEKEQANTEAYNKALEDSKQFLITDEVFKAYKKQLGNATYNDWEDSYGEINIRAALQSNRLMYFLLSTNIQKNLDGDAIEVKYETVDGVDYIDFRTLSYTIKAEDADDDNNND